MPFNCSSRALVGYSPRLFSFAPAGGLRYLNWQHTWWTGAYALLLTKVCLLHRDYLQLFDTILPKHYTDSVDALRNGEDLGMAYVVHHQTHAPAVWVAGHVYEISTGGISSGAMHFDKR
jgi:hypothetical protein